MSGLKRTIEARWPTITTAMVVFVVGGLAWEHFTTRPKANPFKPMELACVDTEGNAATKDNTLRYYRDGGTIVGYDEQGMFYVYTPPRGWVCRFGEVKK